MLPPRSADCTPPPLPQQLFVLHACLEAGEGLEGGAGALPPFTHVPNYTVLPIVHRARLFPRRQGSWSLLAQQVERTEIGWRSLKEEEVVPRDRVGTPQDRDRVDRSAGGRPQVRKGFGYPLRAQPPLFSPNSGVVVFDLTPRSAGGQGRDRDTRGCARRAGGWNHRAICPR